MSPFEGKVKDKDKKKKKASKDERKEERKERRSGRRPMRMRRRNKGEPRELTISQLLLTANLIGFIPNSCPTSRTYLTRRTAEPVNQSVNQSVSF